MTAKIPRDIFQIKASLNNVDPSIWRRLLVPAYTSLSDLHIIMQIVMGWEDDHLHAFTIHGETYSDPQFDEDDELGAQNENLFHLDHLELRKGSRFTYEYDFGDSWELTLLVEKFLPAESGKSYPLCIEGSRAGPPDDSGGPWGYQYKLDVLADPSNEEYDEIREWMGEDFDPEAFDMESVNTQLAELGRRMKDKKAHPAHPELDLDVEMALLEGEIDEPVESDHALDPEQWEKLLTPENEASAQALAIRQDAIAMLAYLKENKVTGTQTTGNFPLKAVEEIAQRFVHPPELETSIGEKVYRFRSEDEVQPVVFVHLLLEAASLLSGGLNKRWRVTPSGEEFTRMEVLSQVWLLFAAWWDGVDWSSSVPFLGTQVSLPENFKETVLELLIAVQPGDEVSYPEFVDRLAEKTGLYKTGEPRARVALQFLIKEMVIVPLSALGVLLTQEEPEPDPFGFPKIESFQLTPLGQGLLGTVQ